MTAPPDRLLNPPGHGRMAAHSLAVGCASAREAYKGHLFALLHSSVTRIISGFWPIPLSHRIPLRLGGSALIEGGWRIASRRRGARRHHLAPAQRCAPPGQRLRLRAPMRSAPARTAIAMHIRCKRPGVIFRIRSFAHSVSYLTPRTDIRVYFIEQRRPPDTWLLLRSELPSNGGPGGAENAAFLQRSNDVVS